MSLVSHALFNKIRQIEITSSQLAQDVLAGSYRSAFRGRGMEFEEVREYQEGDEIRTIDWNVTARMNHPYVKKFQEERELTVWLAVDVSSSTHFGTGSQTKEDLIAEIAAVLSFSATKNNDKVGLILFSEIIEKHILPRKSLRHVLRIVREILTYTPIQHGSNLHPLLNFLGTIPRKPAICFVLSDFLFDHDYDRDLAPIARKHDLIAISVRDPMEIQCPKLDLIRLTDLETGASQVVDTNTVKTREKHDLWSQNQWENHKKLLQKRQASWIELFTNTPYLPALRSFFKARRMKR